MTTTHPPWDAAKELTRSLWTCAACGTFITVHSPGFIAELWCPTCTGQRMTLCGAFEGVLDVRGSRWYAAGAEA